MTNEHHIADVSKTIDHIREATKKVEGCEYCSDRYREPELKSINLYKGPNYYVLDIERPDGFIPEPWRNKRLYVNFCPMCGRRLDGELGKER